MNRKLTLWAVCAVFAVMLSGCACCQAGDQKDASKPALAPPSAAKPMKAVTPDGEAV